MHTRRSFLRTSLAATTAILADVSSIVAKERPAISKSPSDAYVGGVKFLTPEAPDYAAAREVYNAGILTQPKVIACCTSETGVQHALERAKAENWPVAVKAGGHSFEGFCLNDDGLVVSVSPMREMQLDPKTGILTAGAGCRLEEVNQFLLARGRFLPAGSCRTVGLAGLTLGGGYGMFARKWGLTCDHLRRIKMVDGAGIIRDSNEEPDLLWSSRGGGNGHFGIVTELTFNTRPAPAQFSSWKFRAYKLDPKRATALLEAWFDATSDLPNEAFSAWIMNGSQVTVVVITIGSREQKGLVAFRRRLAGLTNKMTSGGPTSLKKALSWYYGEQGPVYFKNASAGYYKGIDDIQVCVARYFRRSLNCSGIDFSNQYSGRRHFQRRGRRLSASRFPLPGRVSGILGIGLARGGSSRSDRSDAQSYCASRSHKPLRKLSRSCFQRLANRLLRRRKLCAPSATETAVRS